MNDVTAAIALRRTRSLTDIVRGEVERMVLSGELKVGERINEQALANRLGVSRGPIREATRALERAGLLTSVVNQGVFVRLIDETEAREIYDVRSVVFGFICKHLAERITPEEVQALEALIVEMDGAIAAADSGRYYQINLAFHDLMADFARHGRAKQTYDALIKESHLLRQSSLVSVEKMRESNSEHTALVAAMAAGDAETARRLAEAHAQGGKRRWLEARNSQETQSRK